MLQVSLLARLTRKLGRPSGSFHAVTSTLGPQFLGSNAPKKLEFNSLNFCPYAVSVYFVGRAFRNRSSITNSVCLGRNKHGVVQQ